MFTGIVEGTKRVAAAELRGGALRLVVDLEDLVEGVRIGDSIAVRGVCLTVIALDGSRASFDAVPETLARTTLGALAAGDAVHIERALRLGDRLGGHLVQGHVDGTARLLSRAPEGSPWGGERFVFAADPALHKGLVPKGSVTLDGVSLTIASLEAATFSVALIPHTLAVTHLGSLAPGGLVHLELDVFGKWAQRALEPILEDLRGRLGVTGI